MSHNPVSNVVTPFVVLALAGATLAGCIQMRNDIDPKPVAERYAFRNTAEPCASWLRSHKTGYLYCASPAVDVPYTAPPAAASEGTDEPVQEIEDMEHLMAHGETVFAKTCAACHQGEGQGIEGMFPPLANNGEFFADKSKHLDIIINGLTGEIEVLGVKYNSAMAPLGATLSDYDIAAVATFERNSLGNSLGGIVTMAEVKAAR